MPRLRRGGPTGSPHIRLVERPVAGYNLATRSGRARGQRDIPIPWGVDVKTIVYQSYRTSGVPAWIERCMGTVRAWASAREFDYGFIDDQLFDYAPPWYRQKVGDHVLLVSDLARLRVARELLGRGYGRAIWVDADALIFDPDRFAIGVVDGYAFCREVWVGRDDRGELTWWEGVNNAVSVFAAGNVFLDFYIHACLSLVAHKDRIHRLDASTNFLTTLHGLMGLPLLTDVGLLSPVMMADLARGTEAALRAYMARFGTPIRAANLCSSFRGALYDGVSVDDRLYEATVDRLLETRGDAINRFGPGPGTD